MKNGNARIGRDDGRFLELDHEVQAKRYAPEFPPSLATAVTSGDEFPAAETTRTEPRSCG